MLASMDALGTIHVRCIANLTDAETVLYTITSVPKEVDDFARLFFNSQRQGHQIELLVLLNDQVIAMDCNGNQLESASVDAGSLLAQENSAVLDNRLLYKLVVNSHMPMLK